MKKILLILALAITLTSCDDDLHSKVINLTVPANQWELNKDEAGLNPYYSCNFDVPEITAKIYPNASVQVYITFENRQQVLPYVRHYENAEGALWTETYDFDYAVGKINFYVTNSDFADVAPPKVFYRVVIIY